MYFFSCYFFQCFFNTPIAFAATVHCGNMFFRQYVQYTCTFSSIQNSCCSLNAFPNLPRFWHILFPHSAAPHSLILVEDPKKRSKRQTKEQNSTAEEKKIWQIKKMFCYIYISLQPSSSETVFPPVIYPNKVEALFWQMQRTENLRNKRKTEILSVVIVPLQAAVLKGKQVFKTENLMFQPTSVQSVFFPKVSSASFDYH